VTIISGCSEVETLYVTNVDGGRDKITLSGSDTEIDNDMIEIVVDNSNLEPWGRFGVTQNIV
jgi:hypothetical protein